MSRFGTTLCLGALLLGAGPLGAQQAPDSAARSQQRMLDSLATALRVLQTRLDSALDARRTEAPVVPVATAPGRAPGTYMNVSFVGLTAAGLSTARDLDRLQLGDHDPRARGFTIPNAELALDGAVDPYFKGFVNLVHKLDQESETVVELEEVYVLTTSLPANLQLKIGQFFAEFGRHNAQHPHSWAFADDAMMLGRIFGADGLRGQGARVSWLLPTPMFAEASFTVLNSAGETTTSFRSLESGTIHEGIPVDREVRGLREMLYVPRFSTSFDLTGSQTLVLGASGAFGPNNTGPDARTRIEGVDLFWKWKSPRARAGFPFVTFQSEVLTRRYDAASRIAARDSVTVLPAAVLKDVGGYAQVQWGIRPLLIAAVRAEVAQNDDPAAAAFTATEREDRNRYSTNLTWFPTEFSKVRVQYNFDRRAVMGNDSSLWFQFEFLLGSHAAHKF